MSYILSALKKVEHKRRSEQLPDLLSAHDAPPPPAARRRPLLKTVVVAGLLLAAGAWFLPSADGQRTLAWLDEQWSSARLSDWTPFTTSSDDARRQAAAPHNTPDNTPHNAPNKPLYKTVQVHEFSPLDDVAGRRVKFPEPLAHIEPPPSAARLAPLKPPRTAAPPRAAAPAVAPATTPAAPLSPPGLPRTAAPQQAVTAPAAAAPATAPAVTPAAPPSPPQPPRTAALQPAAAAPAAPAATMLTPAAPPPAAVQRAAPPRTAPATAPPTAALLTPAAAPAAPVDFDSLPPDTRRRIPAFSVTGHLYSDVRPQANKVIINGAALREGQYVNEDLMVSEINDAGVILDFRGLHFLIAKARIFQ